MYKRILSLVVAVTMLLGMLPYTQFVSAAAVEPETVQTAYLTEETITLDGKLGERSWLTASNANVTTGTSAPTGKVYATWGAGKLHVAVCYTNAATLELLVGTQELHLNLEDNTFTETVSGVSSFVDASASVAEITITLADLNVSVGNYGSWIAFNATLSNTTGSAALAEDAVKLVMTGEYVYDLLTLGSLHWGSVKAVDETVTFTAVQANTRYHHLRYNMPTVVDHTNDVFLSQEITVQNMPATNGSFNGVYGNGYCFYFSDGSASPHTFARANLYKSNAADNTDGSLTLRVQTTAGHQDVELGKKDGNTFRLGFLWTTENTAEIYVDGLHVKTVENVTLSTGAGPGNDACVLNYCVPETTGTVQVSKLAITNVKYKPLELTKDDLLPGVNTGAVTENISLPATYTDPNGHIGTLNLTWSSSDTGVVDNNGVVTRKETAGTATLTATCGNAELAKINITVAAKDPVEAERLPAVWASAINTGDNNLSEIEWTAMSTIDGAVSGSVSAAWDKDALYLGIDAKNATSVTVTYGTYTEKFSVKNGKAEIELSWTALGVTVKELYQTVSGVTLTLSDADENTSEGAFDIVLTSMTANDIDCAALSKSDAANGMTVTSDSISWNVSGTGVSQSYMSNVPLIDHSKDMLLTQTVKIDSMPVGTGYAVNESNASDDCYYFWMSDVQGNPGSAFRCTVYCADEAGNLYIRVHKNLAAGADDNAGVSLGKKLGDTFQLSTLWRKDGGAEVYVDGKLILELDNGTSVLNRYLGNKTYRFAYKNGAGNSAQLTVSDLVLTVSGAETVLDTITPADVLKGMDLSNITKDMVLPATFTSAVVGDIALTWKSSDPSVLSDAGKITRGMKDQTVQLSLYVGEKLLWTVDVTVAGNTVRLEIVGTEELTMDNVMNELCWTDAHSITGSAENAPQGSVSFVYNRNGLYLGLSCRNANKLTAELNGKTMEITLTGSGVKEILLPWSDFGVILDDYGQVIDGLKLTLSGEGGTAVLSEHACEIMLTSKRVTIVPMTAFAKTGNTADVTATASTATFKTNSIDQTRLYITSLSAVDHTKDVLMSQDLLFKTMPVSQGYFQQYGKANDCYYFWMSYGTATSTGPNIQVSVYRADEEGNLWLRACDGDHDNSNDVTVSLGKKLGEKFRLSVLWKAGTAAENYLDGGAEYYVDGKLVLSIADATFSGGGMGIRAIHMAYNNYTAAAAAEFTVSNLNLITSAFASVLDEITTDAMIYGVDLTAVQGDMTLAETFESPYMGSIPVIWSSSNENVITTDGKVTNPEDDTQIPVTLTATAWGEELFEVEVTVVAKPKDANTPVEPSPNIVTTGFCAETIRVDGKISEEGWALTTRVLNDENYIVGKFGAQWNADTLYLAFKSDSAGTLLLELNGKTLEINLDSLQTSGDFEPVAIDKAGAYLELAISLADLGMEIQDYNVRLPISVDLDGSTFEGRLKLISADWFIADNETRPLPASRRGSAALGNDAPVSGFQGVNQVAGGWQMYDLYNPAGNNPGRVRTYVVYGYDAVYAPMAHRSQTIYTEFDFQADALPVYEVADAVGWAFAYNQMASYGMAWSLSDEADSGNMSNSVSLGIFNTSDGLMLAALPSDGATKTVLLNKQVGELFRVGTAWKTNGDVTVYIDGEELITLEGVEGRRMWFGDNTLVFNLIRSTTPAAGEADNMDVTITNLVSGHSYDDSLMDGLNWASICGENGTPDSVTSDLKLPEALFNAQLTTPKTITWTSSNPAVISNTGKVTRPDSGAAEITLTATLADGSKKEFKLRVMGLQNDSGDVLVVSKDYDPAKGAGSVVAVYEITLDSNNTSVIIDLQEKQTVNVVKLTDGDTAARLNEEVLTLWISDDNVTYTQIKDFKLLHQGTNWYLYDFEKEARYVKVHCTHFDPKEADFVAPAANIITAYQDTSLAAENAKTISVPATTLRDQAVEIQLPEGIVQNKLRISLDGKLLYHYVENGNVYVRIPGPTTGELNLWNGAAESLELSNKEYVYEITYGTRETRIISGEAHWLFTLPNGSMLTIRESGNMLWQAFSTDGGRTWSANEQIACSKNYISEGGGFIYDSVKGRLMFQGHLVKNNNTANPDTMNSLTNIIYSDDFGETWEQLATVQTDSNYSLSYTDGIQLSCYDGEGPNVDFVFPMGCYLSNEVGFCARVAYTTDGGKTWQTGEDKIIYDGGYGSEGGVSECTIQERDDGTLVLIGRNQLLDSVHFAQAYSYDHGITWTNPAKLSSNYTGNTQAIMYRYDESMILTWGGNHMMGGASYLRMPYNVAVSYDGMETWKNIQDLYVKYSLQGLTAGTQNRITNQSVQKVGEDDFVSSWWNHTNNMSDANTLMMRVSDFTDYLYRTKGAYDSFEHGTIKYEGWEATGGDVSLSDVYASDGKYSMKLSGATVARSVPYVQNGTVSMDIWVDEKSSFSVELQSAYTNVSGKGAPVGFKVDGYTVTFLGAEETSGLTLIEGWNTVVFELQLDAETPSATLSVNDSEAEAMPVNQQIGDYVSFVTIMNAGTVYVDNFLLVDDQDAEIYEQSAEGKVMQLIAAIGTVTPNSEERIEAARTAYDALTEKQKAKVTNLDVLEEAEAELVSKKGYTVDLDYINVTLDGTIGLNYYVELSDEVATDETAYMEFTHQGATQKIYVKDLQITEYQGKQYYVFTQRVAAKEMNDEIGAVFFFAGGRVSMNGYSVGWYAKERVLNLEYASYTTQKEKDLVVAMLQYGAVAQKYFDYKADDLVTEIDEAALRAVTMGMLEGFVQAYGSGTTNVKLVQTNLQLNTDTNLQFYFKLTTDADTVHFYYEGTELTTIRSGDYYRVDITNIGADDLGRRYKIDIQEGENEGWVEYSAMQYCYQVLKCSTDANLIAQAKAAYLYYQAAINYFVP